MRLHSSSVLPDMLSLRPKKFGAYFKNQEEATNLLWQQRAENLANFGTAIAGIPKDVRLQKRRRRVRRPGTGQQGKQQTAQHQQKLIMLPAVTNSTEDDRKQGLTKLRRSCS